MAARRAEQRTDRARRRGGAYLARGSAAVDVRPGPQREAAEPRVPQETPQPVRRVRAQVRVSPFCVIGGAVLAFLAVLVVFGYVRLYEADSAVSKLETQLSQLQTEQSRLRSAYDEATDLAAVEARAAELGMTRPKASQTVYLTVGARDHAEITPAESQNLFVRLYRALRDSVEGFLEYLS